MCISIICSLKDRASANMADSIIKEYGLEERGNGVFSYPDESIKLHLIEEFPWAYEGADSIASDLIFFLSQHSSKENIPALTTHSMGNWNDENKFGGRPNQLSAPAPAPMLSSLRHLGVVQTGIKETYEATHHGPLLNTPALFMEMGGDESTIENKELAGRVGKAAFESILEIIDKEVDYSKVALGIGGGHYPSKFSALATGRGYAFSYIMPKYAVRRADGRVNLEMLDQAIMKSKDLDLAVIEWKGLDAATRNEVLKSLEEHGIEYERA